MESTFPGFPYEPTRQILEAAKPWSRHTHKLFPAPARARAVELMLVGELLSREERFAAYGPVAVVDAWMAFVVPKAVSRNRVQCRRPQGAARAQRPGGHDRQCGTRPGGGTR